VLALDRKHFLGAREERKYAECFELDFAANSIGAFVFDPSSMILSSALLSLDRE
jgi:hypothetical protein